MASRVLDEVRDTFRADMDRFLAHIGQSLAVVDRSLDLALEAEAPLGEHVDGLMVNLHAISGTASLVGITPLSQRAKELEEAAVQARESIRLVGHHLDRLRALTSSCRDGLEALEREVAAALAAPAPIELDGSWDEPAAPLPPPPVPAARPVLAPPPPPAPVAPAGDGAPDAELLDAFREEALEALTAADEALARLERGSDAVQAAATLSRILHQLKGAAASVGLAGPARLLQDLYRRVGVRDQPGAALASDDVDALVRGLSELRTTVLPARPAPTGPSGGPWPEPPALEPESVMDDDDGGDAETRAIFRDESRRALEEIASLLARVSDARASGAARMAALTRLERIFHRLKGSALVVGEPAIARAAARGQELCEPSGTSITPEELVATVDELRGLLTVEPAAAPAATAPRPAAPARIPAIATTTVALRPRVDGELWDAFAEESSELLDGLDRRAHQLARSGDPRGELAELLRGYHTLKGAANTVGLDPIGAEIHIVESYLTRMLAAPALPALDDLATLLAGVQARTRRNLSQVLRGSIESAVATLARGFDALLGPSPARAPESGAASWLPSSDAAWSSRTDEPPSRDSRGAESRPEPSAPRASDEVAERGDDGDRRFIRVAVDRLDGLMDLVGELVVWRSRVVGRLERLRQLHVDDGGRRRRILELVESFAARTEFANLGGTAAGPTPARSLGGFGALELDQYEEIHVFSRRLDEAANDVVETVAEIDGELAGLSEDADAVASIVGGLQSEITRSRMVPLEALFGRLQLPIRDAAQRGRKLVQIEVVGDDVAIDKAIADALYGPMLHLVRNAVAHGVEAPEARRAAGKGEAGVVTLSARQESGQITLVVSDDGAGIDLAALREVGIRRGLLAPDVSHEPAAILELIFAPGVSTSASVDDVAGRGVGCDVVRRSIERLNGSIRVASTPGAGTTFTISLPMTMSITRAVVARVGERTVALPMFFAERILELADGTLIDSVGRRRLMVDGDLIPLGHLAELFGDALPTTGPVVVCTIGDQRIGVQVDHVLGQEEIVVKSLGDLLEGHPLLAGASLRGDGELALIVDLAGVLDEMVGTSRAPAPRPVELPAVELAPVAGAEPAPAAPVAEVEPSVATGPVRVMFVDDSLSVRKVAERALRGLGVEVVLAVDGQDALEKLRDQEVALVFTDLEMPRMHGLELIRELRYLPRFQHTPIVVISSRSGQKHVDHATGMGADEYLTKPFTADTLADVLTRRAGLRRSS